MKDETREFSVHTQEYAKMRKYSLFHLRMKIFYPQYTSKKHNVCNLQYTSTAVSSELRRDEISILKWNRL